MNDSSKHKLNLSEKRLALLDMLAKQEDLAFPSVLKISPTDRANPVPLSFAQERLWFLDQLEPGSPAYNISLGVHMSGHLDINALEKSIREVLRRHEALRTVFSAENDGPVQRICPAAVFTLQQINLSKLPESRRAAEAKKFAREELSRLFDLVAGPLLRAALLHLKPEEHILILTVHHIVFDAWSTGILHRELSALYKDFLEGNPPSLPELPMQYADFAVWHRKWLHGEKLEEQLKFWKEQLRDITTLELYTDRPRPAVQTFNGSKHAFQFPAGLTETLRGLGHREGVTLFMTLLAAFQVLLHRYTGQSDIVIGTPIANRNRAEIEGLIGFFVNTLVIRADTSGNPVFRKLLANVKKVLLDAYTHQDLPFEKLVEKLQPKRDLSRNPMFQVLFTLQNVPASDLELPGLIIRRIEFEDMRTRFDLEVHLIEKTEGLKGAFIYNTDLFDAATIERMAGHYQRILEGIAADPDQRLSELPLLTETERRQLLVEWNKTERDYPRDKCVHELFQEQVERTPEAIAVVFGDDHLTYRNLNDKANQLAHYLRKGGVGPEVMVGICIERSLEMVICVLGVLKAGGAYVPLDPAYPEERLGFMLEDSRALLLLTRQSLSVRLSENKTQVISLNQTWNLIEEESTWNLSGTASPKNLAYVLYTSGSTGRPKGVAMQHSALCNLISWQIRTSTLSSCAKTLQFASLSFDVSFQEIFSTLCSGGILMVASGELRRDPVSLLHYLEKESVQRLFLPFVALQQIAEVADWHDSFPQGLREVITAGERLRITPPIARMFGRLKDCTLYNQYGPTESHVVTAFQLSGAPGDWPYLPPIGSPVSNAEIYLLDAEYNPVPQGNAGELYIGGECLAREYINRPGLTREKFIADPFSNDPGKLLYKTGDVARYLSDGNIEYLGRSDDQVKVRGFRIEPGEIEAALGLHTAVRETVVVAREDNPGEKRLAAYVVLHKEAAAKTGDLRRFLMERLPDYMVPSVFVILDSLPLTPSGKIDRKALPEPDRNIPEPGKNFVAPRNPLEIQLAEIWEKILDIHPIGVTDNFFDVGGHSLLVVRLIAEVRKITGKNLTVISVFKAPTIEQMARIILNEVLPETSSSLIPIQPHGSKIPLFWVSGSYFMRYLEPDQPVYMLLSWDEHGFIPVFSSIEEIAAHCIQRLLAERPEGPYILGGYCFWGIVALEMARQLKIKGHEVSFLFLVDTSVKYSRDTDQPVKDYTLKSRVIHYIRDFNRLGNREKIAYMFQKIPSIVNWVKGKTVDRLIKNIKIAVCRTYLFFGRPVPRALIKFYVYTLYAMELINKYVPQVYSGRVVLINSDRAGRSVHPDWLDLVQGEVSVHVVPEAKHIDLLKEPYVSVWAKWLNMYLRRAQAIKTERHEAE